MAQRNRYIIKVNLTDQFLLKSLSEWVLQYQVKLMNKQNGHILTDLALRVQAGMKHSFALLYFTI